MMNTLFESEKVRLTHPEPQELADAFTRWGSDMEYYRPLDSDPARLWSAKKRKEWEDKSLEEEDHGNSFFFGIRTRAEDTLIGFVALWGIRWQDGEAFVAIGIGEPAYRGQGYGTQAMQLLLNFAFSELNLRRVSLIVFEYNERAIRSYRKSGYVHEGVIRGAMRRDGRRWDWHLMGVLKHEFLALQAGGAP